MHISCPLNQLSKAVSLAERLSGKKESLPVLSCFHIEARKNDCVVRATNLEAGVEVTVLCKVEKPGVIAVPVALFTQVIKSARGETVEMELVEGTLSIKTKGGKANVKTVAHEEFPTIPTSQKEGQVTLNKKLLTEGITSVVYAAAQSTIRPEFASVYIHQEGQSIYFTATDSFRLAEKKMLLPQSVEIPETLLPTKNALEMIHVLELLDADEVQMVVEDGQVSVESESVRFVSRVIDATFPNYQAIIPKTFVTESIVLKQDLVSALRKARFFAHTTQQVSFHLYPSKKIFTLTASHQDTGEVADTIDATLKGDDLDINFNIGYVADGLGSIPDDSVSLYFAGPGKPLVVRGVTDSTFTYLVMPLNR